MQPHFFCNKCNHLWIGESGECPECGSDDVSEHKYDFVKNDIINFAGELFLVIENNGTTGTVRELGTPAIIRQFNWVFDNVECKLVDHQNQPTKFTCLECGKEFLSDDLFLLDIVQIVNGNRVSAVYRSPCCEGRYK